MRYQDCIFDLYGTLVDIRTDEGSPRLWAHMAELYRREGALYQPDELQSAYVHLVGELENGAESSPAYAHEAHPEIQLEKVFQQLYQAKGVEADAALAVHTGQAFRKYSTEYLRLYPGAAELLRALRAQGCGVWLLSNAQSIFTRPELEELGLDSLFDGVYLSSDYSVKKPDARFYQALLQTRNIPPDSAVMSPNGTIRSILDGTVFRTPICIDAIKPVVKNWKKPITIARHAYGDVYKSVDFVTEKPGVCTMTFKSDDDSEEKTVTVQKTDGPTVWQGAHNKDKSIRSFARSCFQYAIDTKQDLWFSTKDTIAKVYDGEFKKIFEEVFESYKARFEELGITYFYTLIDDAVARVIRSEGGYIWACKNYDGDVMSDMVSTAFGSLAMMTSVLVAPDGTTEYEAAHGTVTKHYYKHLKGEKTSTNSMATIFAWSGALRKRGELDGLTDLVDYAGKLEEACFDTLNAGIMTKDLVGLVEPGFEARAVNSEEFLDAIAERLAKKL